MLDISRYNSDYLRSKAPKIFTIARKASSIDDLLYLFMGL